MREFFDLLLPISSIFTFKSQKVVHLNNLFGGLSCLNVPIKQLTGYYKVICLVFTAHQRSGEGNVFSGVCLSVCLSTGRPHVVITHEPVQTCSLGDPPLFCPHKDLTIQGPVQTCLQVGGWHSMKLLLFIFAQANWMRASSCGLMDNLVSSFIIISSNSYLDTIVFRGR